MDHPLKELLKEVLKDKDRAFCKAVANYRLEAWVEHFAFNGVMVNSKGKLIKGHDAIRNAMKDAFDNPSFSLTWEPVDAEISESGDLGYTFGDYIRLSNDDSGNLVETRGRYTTIWRKQHSGEWLIELDTGN